MLNILSLDLSLNFSEVIFLEFKLNQWDRLDRLLMLFEHLRNHSV